MVRRSSVAALLVAALTSTVLAVAGSAAQGDPLPDLELGQVTTGNIVKAGTPLTVKAVTAGGRVSWTLTTTAGGAVETGIVYVNAEHEALIELGQRSVGHYTLKVQAFSGATGLGSKTTSLAVVPASTVPETPYGVVGHFHREEWGDPTQAVPLLEMAGIDHVRESVLWEDVEKAGAPAGARYDFSGYDDLADEFGDRGLTWLAPVQYTHPSWGDRTPVEDDEMAAFGDYAGSTVSHFSDEIDAIEVYNEYNLLSYGNRGPGCVEDIAVTVQPGCAQSLPENYAALLAATVSKLPAGSDAGVVAPSLAGMVKKDELKGPSSSATRVCPTEERRNGLCWLADVLKRVASASGPTFPIDNVGIHPYTWPLPPERALSKYRDLDDILQCRKTQTTSYYVRDVLPTGGCGWTGTQPWVTEQGWPTSTEDNTETQQAQFIPRAVTMGMAHGVERYFVYSFMDEGSNADAPQQNFGLIRNTTSPLGRWTPKPAYVAYAVLINQLGSRPWSGTETLVPTMPVMDGINETGQYTFVTSNVFGSGSQTVRAISASHPTTLRFTSAATPAATELLGRSCSVGDSCLQRVGTTSSYDLTVKAGETVYLRGSISNLVVQAGGPPA